MGRSEKRVKTRDQSTIAHKKTLKIKLPQKNSLVFKILCHFFVAINVLIYFLFDSKVNGTSFSVEAVILILIIAIEGFDQAYVAIVRKDFAVGPAFFGAIIISVAITIEAYKNISVNTAMLMLCCLIVQCISLVVFYFKFVIKS